MAEPKSPHAVWLEDLLQGWTLPGAALAVIALTGGLYLLGLVDEEHTAGIAIGAIALATSLYMVRESLSRTGADRAVAVAAAIATLLAVVLPAIPTVWPGKPVFEGELGAEGDRIALPPGTAGSVRLLVAGRLRQGGEPSASYTIEGPASPVEGRLERVYRQVRVGRGGRARVAEDHTADWYDVVIPSGARELTLRRVSGQLGGRLLVSGHRSVLPPPWPWALCGLALALSALAEARLGKKSGVAVPAGMALAFGLLVMGFATPYAAVGPVMGAVVLGAILGSLGGWIVGALARRLLSREAGQGRPASGKAA
jgi:hypothetical protein